MFYFGVEDKHTAGHYLFDERMWKVNDSSVPENIDGGFCPKGIEIQGHALITRVNGKTILSFWDRSGDKRFGSHSTFIEEGTLTFNEMLADAKIKFPKVFERINFEIKEIQQ